MAREICAAIATFVQLYLSFIADQASPKLVKPADGGVYFAPFVLFVPMAKRLKSIIVQHANRQRGYAREGS